MRTHLNGFTATGVILIVLGFSQLAMSQSVSAALILPDAPMNSRELEPTPFASTSKPVMRTENSPKHKFWDRENNVLFAATAGLSAADFVVTRNNLRNGGQEFNPVTRVMTGSTGALAANFAGETAGVIGLSYFLHRTGHHKLERAVSLLDIGGSASAVSFGLLHR